MISSAGRRQKKKSRRRADNLTRPFETAVLRNQSRRFFAFTQTYNDLQGHGSHLEVKLPCPVCVSKVRMIYIS